MDSPNIAKTRFWNRVQLILILVVFAAPLVGAYFYKPSSFSSYGDLYTPPRTIDNLEMRAGDTVVELHALRRQWVFLVLAQEQCGEACEANILKMRQLRFMQNNDMSRIRTVFIHSGLEAARAEDLAAKYHPIEAYTVPMTDFSNWVNVFKLDNAPKAAQKDRLYIIDPSGNLMMSYPSSAEPKLIQKDIKRLLKASQIG